jgi:hypothetical protein
MREAAFHTISRRTMLERSLMAAAPAVSLKLVV